jgi:RNA polymerase sigma factor (sigma-70 family)
MISTADLLSPLVPSGPAEAATPEAPFDWPLCLRRVRQGDQAAARELVDRVRPVVARIVRAHRPFRVAEEDLTQDVFLKIFRRLDQYQADAPLPHWVSRIAYSTCIDRLRAQRRRPELCRADLSEAEGEQVDNARCEATRHPATALDARELVATLLDRLSTGDRQLLQLLDLKGHSIAAISHQTGLSPGLVKVRAFRARQKLHQLFARMERPR